MPAHEWERASERASEREREREEGGERERSCLLFVYRPSNMLVYLRDGETEKQRERGHRTKERKKYNQFIFCFYILCECALFQLALRISTLKSMIMPFSFLPSSIYNHRHHYRPSPPPPPLPPRHHHHHHHCYLEYDVDDDDHHRCRRLRRCQ